MHNIIRQYQPEKLPSPSGLGRGRDHTFDDILRESSWLVSTFELHVNDEDITGVRLKILNAGADLGLLVHVVSEKLDKHQYKLHVTARRYGDTRHIGWHPADSVEDNPRLEKLVREG